MTNKLTTAETLTAESGRGSHNWPRMNQLGLPTAGQTGIPKLIKRLAAEDRLNHSSTGSLIAKATREVGESWITYTKGHIVIDCEAMLAGPKSSGAFKDNDKVAVSVAKAGGNWANVVKHYMTNQAMAWTKATTNILVDDEGQPILSDAGYPQAGEVLRSVRTRGDRYIVIGPVTTEDTPAARRAAKLAANAAVAAVIERNEVVTAA